MPQNSTSSCPLNTLHKQACPTVEITCYFKQAKIAFHKAHTHKLPSCLVVYAKERLAIAMDALHSCKGSEEALAKTTEKGEHHKQYKYRSFRHRKFSPKVLFLPLL